MIIVQAIYGIRSTRSSLWKYLGNMLDKIVSQKPVYDPDIWLKPEVKSDGETYSEYVICYIDKIIIDSIKALEIMI